MTAQERWWSIGLVVSDAETKLESVATVASVGSGDVAEGAARRPR
jgi:hypothetical protein